MKKLLLLAAMAIFTTVSETSCKKNDDAKFCWECLQNASDTSKGYNDVGCNQSQGDLENRGVSDANGTKLNVSTQCRKK